MKKFIRWIKRLIVKHKIPYGFHCIEYYIGGKVVICPYCIGVKIDFENQRTDCYCRYLNHKIWQSCKKCDVNYHKPVNIYDELKFARQKFSEDSDEYKEFVITKLIENVNRR